MGGRIRGTKRKSKGNESKRANERTNGVLNIAKKKNSRLQFKKILKKKVSNETQKSIPNLDSVHANFRLHWANYETEIAE